MKPSRLRYPVLLPLAMLLSSSVWGQIKTPVERLEELEKRVARLNELEERVKDLEQELEEKSDDGGFAKGLLTLGGERFRLGGKVEFLFIDTEAERIGAIGSTEEADPRFAIDVFRLEPRIDLNDEVSLRAQLDFKPRRGRVKLKEATIQHRAKPRWWLQSTLRLGLDDRFIRMRRETENYPLLGNAFWRDESLAFWWRLRFGDRDGLPEEESADGEEDEDRPAFDFADNPGAFTFHFSFGNGYTLDGNEVGEDDALFNPLVHDDRNVSSSLSLRELGFGLEYSRSFREYGELDVMTFYYNDELNSDSVQFLQNDLTARDFTNTVIAGYGDSSSDTSYRYGVGGEYFVPAKLLVGDLFKTRGRDGLRIAGQWIFGRDGQLERDGWFVQASYRYSFSERLLFDRYFRSISPVVRYGELDTNIDPSPTLPGTWDRDELLIGIITEITNDMLLKFEYTFHDESPGAGGPKNVDNNEFLAQLLVRF